MFCFIHQKVIHFFMSSQSNQVRYFYIQISFVCIPDYSIEKLIVKK